MFVPSPALARYFVTYALLTLVQNFPQAYRKYATHICITDVRKMGNTRTFNKNFFRKKNLHAFNTHVHK